MRGGPVDGRGEKREASPQSTCSLAQQLRLSDGARFRRCVTCVDPTLIRLGSGTDQIHVRSARQGEDKMDTSSHESLEARQMFSSAALPLRRSFNIRLAVRPHNSPHSTDALNRHSRSTARLSILGSSVLFNSECRPPYASSKGEEKESELQTPNSYQGLNYGID